MKPGRVGDVHPAVGASGRTPSSATIGARIACLGSFYRPPRGPATAFDAIVASL